MTGATPDDIQELLIKLGRTPILLADLVEGLTRVNVALRPAPDQFSALESICHLRDIEIEAYAIRIRRILAEDRPALADVNGARLAIERDYNRLDLSEALTSFTTIRQKNLQVLSDVSLEEFDREGELDGVGTISLGKLIEIMAEHDEDHVAELRVIRAQLLRAHEA